jgi:hypothetical protein
MRKVLVIAIALLAGAVPLSAQQRLNPQAGKNPYAKLFETRDVVKLAVEQQRSRMEPTPRTRIVCGMTVVEVAPAIDPKMGVTPPKDEKTRYSIRAVEPPLCK